MKFGYYILNTYVPELDGNGEHLYGRWLEQIDAAEELNFHSLWVTEHHFRLFGGMMPNPQLLLVAAAQRTQRLRLGTAVSLVPMHHPVKIAEDFAMLDLLSSGRLNFGAGRGMSAHEYEVFGREFKTAQSRLVEAVQLILHAWTEEVLDWEGQYYQYHGLTVRPKPKQQPHPPVYVTANKDPESFRMVASHGYNLMTLPWLFGNEVQGARVREYLEILRESGHATEERDVFVMYPAYVGETDLRAREEALDAWHRWREFALEEVRMDPGRAPLLEQIHARLGYDAMVSESRAVFGGPETCIKQLQTICNEVGPTHIGLCFHFGGLSQARVLASMERFSRHVAPAFIGVN